MLSFLPTCRISVASFMKALMSATICCAASMSMVSFCTVAVPLRSLAFSSAILSSLSDLDVLDVLSSLSHHSLCSSSSFCSSISRKIIFWIMLMTSPNGSSGLASSWATSRSSALECTTRAAARSRLAALVRGSSSTCRNEGPDSDASRGEGGGTGFFGASVRTPVALDRIVTAIFMASSSRARTADRSSHSCFLRLHALSVSPRVSVSATRSA
mmetsp:Transcript_9015/g.26533  ORF Transcript_9015/g.26533 Transcript_9015/m.26533 type:complete len:214 (-) Transcript_9015:943-1584(-)